MSTCLGFGVGPGPGPGASALVEVVCMGMIGKYSRVGKCAGMDGWMDG